MSYNLQHGSPELVKAHSGGVTLQIDAQAQDLWSIGSLLLFTLTQRAWFAPTGPIVGHELAEAVKAFREAWVSSPTFSACSETLGGMFSVPATAAHVVPTDCCIGYPQHGIILLCSLTIVLLLAAGSKALSQLPRWNSAATQSLQNCMTDMKHRAWQQFSSFWAVPCAPTRTRGRPLMRLSSWLCLHESALLAADVMLCQVRR